MAQDTETDYAQNDEQSATILVYMCAGTLESETASATTDIEEMISATYDSGVRVVLQTGGTTAWHNDFCTVEGSQRWCIDEHGMQQVGDSPNACMSDADTLADFVAWGTNTYPADRTELIIWGHGAGSSGGVIYDDRFPESNTLSLADVENGLRQASCHLEFVGFDSCLMSSAETALAVAPYADYLIAAEVEEPDTGWDYKRLIDTLSGNTAIPGWLLVDTVCRQFRAESTATAMNYAIALTALDLSDADALNSALDRFGAALCNLTRENPQAVLKARQAASLDAYSSNAYDMIDLMRFTAALPTLEEESADLVAAIAECRESYCATGAARSLCGVSLYLRSGHDLPENSVALSDMSELLPKLGIADSWVAFQRDYEALP